jgi:hypothetical protein
LKGFQFEFEEMGGWEYEFPFTIAFNATPFSPAKTQGDPDDCHDAEGGEIEDLTVFIQANSGPMSETRQYKEVPEFLWPALGFVDRDRLVEMCEEHVKDEQERQEADEGDRKCDEARDERGGR